jgi:hypothetical protein
MNEEPTQQPSPAIAVLLFLAGAFGFWFGAFVANLFVLSSASLATGLLFLLIVLGVAGYAYRSGLRSLAAGVVFGYAVLGILSGGTCILFRAARWGG